MLLLFEEVVSVFEVNFEEAFFVFFLLPESLEADGGADAAGVMRGGVGVLRESAPPGNESSIEATRAKGEARFQLSLCCCC